MIWYYNFEPRIREKPKFRRIDRNQQNIVWNWVSENSCSKFFACNQNSIPLKTPVYQNVIRRNFFLKKSWFININQVRQSSKITNLSAMPTINLKFSFFTINQSRAVLMASFLTWPLYVLTQYHPRTHFYPTVAIS